jgi:hypothetical protein
MVESRLKQENGTDRDHFISDRSNKRAGKVSRVLALQRAIFSFG